MFSNEIVVIDGRLFRNHPELNSISLADNRIESIDRTFINGLNNLSYIHLAGNNCTDLDFTRGTDGWTPPLATSLVQCFDTFGPPEPDVNVRRFHMVLEGELILTEL